MGLTVTTGDPLTKFITSGGYGAVAMDGVLFFVGRGTSGVTTVLYVRNGDLGTAATSEGEPVYVKAHADQNAFTVAGSRPA